MRHPCTLLRKQSDLRRPGSVFQLRQKICDILLIFHKRKEKPVRHCSVQRPGQMLQRLSMFADTLQCAGKLNIQVDLT